MHKRTFLVTVFSGILILGCGGGGGGPGGSVVSGDQSVTTLEIGSIGSSQVLTGRFIDSPVEGLVYRSASQEGTTASDGSFKYINGEVVEFLISGQPIGQAPGKGLVHISDLTAPGFVRPDSQTSLRIAQVLQTLDADRNPGNGIRIDQSASVWFSIPKLDFTSTDASFSSAFAGAVAPDRVLVSTAVAKQHVETYLKSIAVEFEAACGAPRGQYSLHSIADQSRTEIDTSGPLFDCHARSEVLAYKYKTQPALSSELANLISQSAVFVGAGENEQTEIEEAGKKSALLISAKAVSLVVDGIDATVKIVDAKSTMAVVDKIAQAGIGLIDNLIGSSMLDSSAKEDLKLRTQLASVAITTIAKTADCAKLAVSDSRANACSKAVFGALKLVVPTLKLVVTDAQAKTALGLVNTALELAESLQESKANPAKVKSALVVASTDFLRITGTLIANANTSAASGLRTLWSESLTQVSESAKGYAACITALVSVSDFRACKDATLNRTLDNLSKLVFRAGLIWNLSENLSEIDTIYLTDKLLRDYLSVGGNMKAWYALYGIADATTRHVCWLVVACADNELQHERAMFEKAILTLQGQGLWSDKLPIEQTWRKFVEERALLTHLAGIYEDATSLAMQTSVDQVNKSVLLSVTGMASNFDSIQCTSEGATPSIVNMANGNGGSQLLKYASPGIYQIGCVGRKDGSAVMARAIAISVSACEEGMILKLGTCLKKPAVAEITPQAAVNGSLISFKVIGANLPSTAVLSVQDATCLPPSGNTSVGFTQSCTLGSATGAKTITVKTDTDANSGTVIDSTKSVNVAAAVGLFSPNGNRYEIINCGTWTQCDIAAKVKGGNLVTIRSKAENDWILANFGSQARTVFGFWIGQNELTGLWGWRNGAADKYTNWDVNEPNAPSTDHFAHMYTGVVGNIVPGTWNNTDAAGRGLGIVQGIVEYVSAPTSNASLDIDLTPAAISALGGSGVGSFSYESAALSGRNRPAAKFTAGYLRVPNRSAMQFTAGATFDMWARIDSITGMTYHTLLAKSHDRTGGAFLATVPHPSTGVGLGYVHSANFDPTWAFSYSVGCQSFPAVANVAVGAWYRMTISISATAGWRHYVNKQLVQSCPTVRPSFAVMNTQDLYIGRFGDGFYYPLNGAISDIRIYQKALSEAEVAALP